jgi:hypothetical protein
VDESAFVSNLQYLYSSIIIPATLDRQFQLIFPSTPPLSPAHFWAAELVPKAKERNTYLELTLDSMNISESEKERLLVEVGGRHSSTARREFYCEVVTDESRSIAPSFSQQKHITNAHEIPNIKYMVFGDLGGRRDKTCFLLAAYNHDTNQVHILDELVFEPETPTAAMRAQLQNKGWDRYPTAADMPEIMRIDWAQDGFPVASVIKDNFHAGLQLLDSTFFQNKIVIHSNCKLLLQTLSTGLLTPNRQDYERTPELGHCDAIAALIYCLRGIDRITDLRPKPNQFQVFTPPPPQNPIIKIFN